MYQLLANLNFKEFFQLSNINWLDVSNLSIWVCLIFALYGVVMGILVIKRVIALLDYETHNSPIISLLCIDIIPIVASFCFVVFPCLGIYIGSFGFTVLSCLIIKEIISKRKTKETL